jgi:hypothetical protein
VNQANVSKVAFALSVLLCKNVTLESMLSFDLASASDLESLLGTSVGFHFWHEN